MMGPILSLLLCLTGQYVTAFSPHILPASRRPFSGTSKHEASSSRRRTPWTDSERNRIIGREGEVFKLDRMRGKIEFGSSARIVTKLEGADTSSVSRWLSDDRAIALSIWDEKLIKEIDTDVYRLKLMTLMFVTIQLAPSVDLRMWTESQSSDSLPMFKLESVGFDPNIQILPGVGVSADSLGIKIDVVGELYPSRDGKGVDGKIGFVTSGELPPPMRLLPEQALRSSMSTINRTITNFAVSSFQRGTREKFREFLRSERLAQTK